MKSPSRDTALLGIDIGTGSSKVALLGGDGTILGLEKQDHSLVTPREGWVEIPIRDIRSNIEAIFRRLLKNSPVDPKSVGGIGISSLCPGLTPMTEDGTALADPIIYMDTRSIDEAEDIRKRLGEDDLFKLSANKIMPGACSLTSILWFRNRRPDVHRKTTVYGHLNTYIGKNLTGNFGIDFSNASYTGLFNTGGNPGWSRETCETLGLDPAILPPLVPSWVSVGGLAERSLIAAGFRPGIPVAMGGGDTACAAFAVGVLDHNQVFESAGTTNVLTACSEKPVFDPRFMNRRHVVPGRWLYHGAMSSTGASVRWLRDEVFQIEEDAEYEKISRLADKSAADAPCPVFLPYMAGERSPIWDPRARGVFFGLSLHTKREHLVRAMFEACAYGNRQLLEIVERMTGEKTEKILSIGGWSAIDIWNQIKADILGRKICALDVSEAAVAGAALLGGMASGVFSNFHDAAARVPKIERKVFTPNSTYKKFYDKRFSVYSALYPKIRDLF